MNQWLRWSLMRWRQISYDIGHKQIGVLAAGIAFYTILAFFPLVIALVALGSIVLDSHSVEQVARLVSEFLPGDIASTLDLPLQHALSQHIDNIIVAILAILVSLFSVSRAVRSLMGSLNLIYGQHERRSFWHQQLTALLLAAGIVVAMFASLTLLLLGRDVLVVLGLSHLVLDSLVFGRWVLLAAAMIVALNVLYQVGPSREHHGRWPGFSRGIMLSTGLWIGSSVVFFYYISHLTHLSTVYSLFAGVIGLMLWFNLTSFVVLLGADVDRQLALAARAPTPRA